MTRSTEQDIIRELVDALEELKEPRLGGPGGLGVYEVGTAERAEKLIAKYGHIGREEKG